MAISVDIQDNPAFADVGTDESNCVVITSGYTSGTVRYLLARYDTWDGTYSQVYWGEVYPEDYIELWSNETYDNNVMPQVVSISATELKIMLKNRTNYVVETFKGKDSSGAIFFKTRDKKYSTPDAITQLTSDVAYTDAGATVTVTNDAKATVTETVHGATVVNADTYTLTETSKGATIVV